MFKKIEKNSENGLFQLAKFVHHISRTGAGTCPVSICYKTVITLLHIVDDPALSRINLLSHHVRQGATPAVT